VAYALVGWTYFTEWFMGWGQDSQILEQALALAQKARTLDDFLPQAHALLSLVYTWQKQDEQALAEAERAITLNSRISPARVPVAVKFPVRYISARPIAVQRGPRARRERAHLVH